MNDPDAVSRFTSNAEVLRHLALRSIPRLAPQARGAWQSVLEEFEDRRSVLTDCTAAAARIEILAGQFSDNKKITIPQVYWEHTNPNVLVHSWSNLPRLARVAANNYLVRYLLDAFVSQYGSGGHTLLRPTLADFQVAPGNCVVFENPQPIAYIPPEVGKRAVLFVWLLLENQWELAGKSLLSMHYAASHERELHRAGSLVLRKAEGEGVSEKLWHALEAAWQGGLVIPLAVTEVCESILFLEHLVARFDSEIDFGDGLRAAIKKQAPAFFGVKRTATATSVASAGAF